MAETVAAVVVTFNRKELLAECLDALLRQSRSVDRIIVIDNASTDGTEALLLERDFLAKPQVDYVRLATNIGGAGGFHEGARRAYEAGYDWIWIMDDDAEPELDCLQQLQRAMSVPEAVAVACLPVGSDGIPQYYHRGWMDVCHTDGRVIRAVTPGELAFQLVSIEHASFVGLAVRREGITAAGLPRAEMFIHYDDLEYCGRLVTIGKILLATDSRIIHKDQRARSMVRRSLLGRGRLRVPFERLWLYYYGPRNLVWLRRRSCPWPVVATFALRTYLKTLGGIVAYDDQKCRRAWFYFNAILDGWRGVFDNDTPRRITQTR